MALPRFVVLKSNYNKNYLRYINEDVQVHGFLQFTGEKVVSPYSKFEVEMAKSGNGLVHLRSCYNNKYWVRQSQNSNWIVTAAEEPEEDQSKWSCTLFKPVFLDDGAKTIRLVHVQLGKYACLWRTAAPFDSCLFASSKDTDKDSCDVYSVIDWESLLILPKHVAFKDDNGNYLCASWVKGNPYMQSGSADIGNETVANEVFITNDGSIRLKSNHFDKFWRLSPSWIWVDSGDTTNNNSDTLFWPVKVDENVVALRNLGNNRYCKRLTVDGKTNCLNAAVSTITKEARLTVEEVVISREIYNVNFRLLDAKIYDQNDVIMVSQDVINNTNNSIDKELKLSYTYTTTSTWNASVSLKLGVKTSIQSGIPLIAEGKIEISAEFNGAYKWGETKESSYSVEDVTKVKVSPMSKVKVSVIATRGSCDVPFSYTQSDTLTDGTQKIYNMDDGIYSGINYYNFKTQVDPEEKL